MGFSTNNYSLNCRRDDFPEYSYQTGNMLPAPSESAAHEVDSVEISQNPWFSTNIQEVLHSFLLQYYMDALTRINAINQPEQYRIVLNLIEDQLEMLRQESRPDV